MDEEKVYYTIILRHDTSTNWMMNNPILALSEYGVEDDTHRVKRGDGQSNWADLPYEHFGLEYLVTYENLIGEVSDSRVLKDALNEKVDKSIFTENANGLIENITLTDEAGSLGLINRITKDVTTGGARQALLRIKSDDNSIQGVYTIDEEGIRTLNLKSYSHIYNYEAGKTYYLNEICYYDNKLYRCLEEEFVAEQAFTKAHWVLLASLHANDIKYNHLTSGLEATDVKGAIDELADLDSEKVKKTSRENKVYGTNEFGEQYLYNKDDLRKLDTVNHKQADLNKNVQLDASDINYLDTDPGLGTVRQVLDSKVDKTVAGQGARIVRDIQFEYNEPDGHITLIEDKVSLENGTSVIERKEINVVSERELSDNVTALNTRIDTEVNTLDTRITNEVSTLNTRIDTEVADLNDRVDEEVDTLNDRIDTEVQTINTAMQTEQTRVNSEIERLDGRIDDLTDTVADNKADIESKLDEAKIDYNTKINNAVNTLNNTIGREVDILNNRIDFEVNTLNTTIDDVEADINDRIDEEVQTLNDKIDGEESVINQRIDQEVATLNNTINTKETAMDNKKINKSIAPGLVSEIIAATESNEPTLKITTRNTTTETPTVSHLHFKAQGQILTRFQDADHIVIDSTNIDDKNNQQDTRLTNAETRISANEDNITTLQTHDASHDTTLALHAQQIADNTHDIQDLQADMTDANYDIGRLQTQNATQETHLTNLDELVQANADDIVTANQNISRNLQSITDLQANKANKTFANLTNNKVVGTIATEALQNNEIIKLGVTSVDPSTETTSNGILKVISSDNTIVATRDIDTGVIDLKANLDTDVNYFVTTEILSDTIPSENIIPLNTLTPTDKVQVEVHDIISDPEGTWARVQSINTTLETCVAVTFKKHAQAVWGTIKGNIADQQDLQEQFSDLETSITADITAEENARIAADDALQDNIDLEAQARQDADDALQANIDAEETARIAADNNLNSIKFDKSKAAHMFAATDATSTDYKNIYQSGIEIHAQKSTYVDSNSIELVSYYRTESGGGAKNLKLAFENRDIQIAFGNADYGDTIWENDLDWENQVKFRVQPENVIFDPSTSGLISTKLSPAIREVKEIVDTKVTLTDQINKVYGTDANGDQVVYDKNSFGKVDTVNNTQADANKNVQLDASKINLDDTAQATETLQSIINNLIADLQTQISTYAQNTLYVPTGTYTLQKYVTVENDQNVIIMAKILKNFTSDTTQSTLYDSFMKDVELGNLKLIGIPEQTEGGTTPDPQEYIDTFDDLNQVMGTDDEYNGLGGTEEEVEDILDDILGN